MRNDTFTAFRGGARIGAEAGTGAGPKGGAAAAAGTGAGAGASLFLFYCVRATGLFGFALKTKSKIHNSSTSF